jgi:hypothetical protein
MPLGRGPRSCLVQRRRHWIPDSAPDPGPPIGNPAQSSWTCMASPVQNVHDVMSTLTLTSGMRCASVSVPRQPRCCNAGGHDASTRPSAGVKDEGPDCCPGLHLSRVGDDAPSGEAVRHRTDASSTTLGGLLGRLLCCSPLGRLLGRSSLLGRLLGRSCLLGRLLGRSCLLGRLLR